MKASELREAGIRKRIVVLTGFWPGEEKRLIKHDLTMTVSRADDLRYLERAAKASRLKAKVPFHLKINTGMNRLGISPDEVDSFARLLSGCRHIQLEGTYTHFASAEDFTSGQTCEQEKLFLSCLDRLRKLGVSPGIVHMANSGAISARSETWADMVRPGAILYGYYQSFDPPQKKRGSHGTHAAGAVSCSARRIISLRDLPPGQSVGYAARFITKRASRIAVINAGYADGVVRALTNKGQAIVRGQRVPLVGTISMDSDHARRYRRPRREARRRGNDLRQGWQRGNRRYLTWPRKSVLLPPISFARSDAAFRFYV